MVDPSTAAGSPHEERRYWGKYRGFVADNQDPKRLGRLKVRVPEILGREIITDWATTNPKYGGLPETGSFVGLDIGAAVFVEFESGSVDRPLVTGTWWGQPKDGSPEPPALTRSDGKTCFKDDPSVGSPKGEDGFVSADGESQCQPASPLLTGGGPEYPNNRVLKTKNGGGPEYPNNRVLKTKNNGITVEVDDTPGRPRVQVYLGGSWLELDKDGLSIRVNGKEYHLVEQDRSVKSTGAMHFFAEDRLTMRTARDRFLAVKTDDEQFVEGDRKVFVNGNKTVVIQGDVTETIIGNRSVTVIGQDTLIGGGAINVNAAAQYGIAAGGVITLAGTSVSLGGGGSPQSPQNPESPPVLPDAPSCPSPPPAPTCPPLPSSGT
jgi:hypothetical protein